MTERGRGSPRPFPDLGTNDMASTQPLEPIAPDTVALDALADQVRDGLARMHRAEDDWAEAAIDTCRALAAAKERYPQLQAFGQWCEANGFGPDVLNHQDRAAAITMGLRLPEAEPVLRATDRRSLRLVCEKECRFTSAGKTDPAKEKKPPPPPRNIELTPDLFERIAAKLKAGMAQEDVVETLNATINEGPPVTRYKVQIVTSALKADADQAGSARPSSASFERALRKARIAIRTEIEAELREEHRRWFEDIYIPHLNEKSTHADRIIAAHKGLIPRATFRKILACLHPDNTDEGRKERFSEAFQAFRELEAVLVKEDTPTRDSGLPKTLGELMARRRSARR